MKRKLADRLDWNRVLHRKFISKFVDEVDFKGHITLISIYQVKESLRRNIKINEDDYRLAKSVMTDLIKEIERMENNNIKNSTNHFEYILMESQGRH